MKFLFRFENFESGKMDFEDIEIAWKNKKSIFSPIVKNKPNHKFETPLEIVNIDKESGEIGVIIDGDLYYVDLEDIERIEQ